MGLCSRDNKHCGTLYFTFQALQLEKKKVIISRSTFPQHLHDYNEAVSLWFMWISHTTLHSKVFALLFL